MEQHNTFILNTPNNAHIKKDYIKLIQHLLIYRVAYQKAPQAKFLERTLKQVDFNFKADIFRWTIKPNNIHPLRKVTTPLFWLKFCEF